MDIKNVEYFLIIIAGIMGVFNDKIETKSLNFIYKLIFCICIIGAGVISYGNDKVIANKNDIERLNDSILYDKNKREIVDSLTNSFNLQKVFIGGQLIQLGFKIDAVSNKIIKKSDRVMSDSLFNKLVETSKHSLLND